MVIDLAAEIEAEMASIKLEIERLKTLAKKRMGQPHSIDEITSQLRELHVRLSELERNLRNNT
jgi:septal ring factor EnvC (AmiA/AmiB activator)